MPTFYRPAQGTMTAVAGTASLTIQTMHGFITQIFVESATSSTTFDVKVTDDGSRDIYHAEDATGVLNDETKIPTFNPVTLTIENASVDEVFKYKLALQE